MRLLKPKVRPWWALFLALRLQRVPRTARDTNARAYHDGDSSTCHPRRVTHMQDRITMMTPVHVTHDEWHVHTSTLPSLQCVPPTTSGMPAREYYYHGYSVCHPRQVTHTQERTIYDSSTCHPHRVACGHEHPTKPSVRVIPDMCARASY